MVTPSPRRAVSVIITTFNEERNISECIESVLWADEIFLVDSFSSDRTMELAKEFCNRIIGLQDGVKMFDGPTETLQASDLEAIYAMEVL